jgi:hypothetical protein
MADRPDRPPGQRSLFDLCVKRVEKRPPPEVDRAEVEREMAGEAGEARWRWWWWWTRDTNRAGGGEKGVLLGRAAGGFKMLDLERLPGVALRF